MRRRCLYDTTLVSLRRCDYTEFVMVVVWLTFLQDSNIGNQVPPPPPSPPLSIYLPISLSLSLSLSIYIYICVCVCVCVYLCV